jgi:hypothetical protein
MCSEEFIGALAAEIAARECGPNHGAEDFGRIAHELWSENARSVGFRYAASKSDLGIEGAAPEYARKGAAAYAVVWTPAELGCAAQCLEYQSCECDDWQSTGAAEILRRLKDSIIRGLPGYDAAPWGSLPARKVAL